MFWHESQENDINIYQYNKSDFMKLSSPNKLKDNEKNTGNIVDFSEQFQIGIFFSKLRYIWIKNCITVATDWGPGKIISINKQEKKVRLKIFDQEQVFNMHELRVNNQIIVHIYFKDMNLIDKKIMYLMTLSASDTILDMKKKIAKILGTSENRVTLIQENNKITNDNKKFSEIGFYDLISVVNGRCDY